MTIGKIKLKGVTNVTASTNRRGYPIDVITAPTQTLIIRGNPCLAHVESIDSDSLVSFEAAQTCVLQVGNQNLDIKTGVLAPNGDFRNGTLAHAMDVLATSCGYGDEQLRLRHAKKGKEIGFSTADFGDGKARLYYCGDDDE